MKNNISTTRIQEFVTAYQAGMDAWKRAGEIIVQMVEDDPDVYNKIIEQCPLMNQDILATFERIGRGLLYAPLAMDSSPGGSKLKTLPISQQMKYETEPIPLLVLTPDGGTDKLLVKAKDMTKDQARQVFANGRIRTEGEQKALIIEQKQKAATVIPRDNISAWKIKGSKVVINGVEFSRKELAVILAQMD